MLPLENILLITQHQIVAKAGEKLE